MDYVECFKQLRTLAPDWDGAYPPDWTVPTRDDFDAIHEKYDCRYPPSFIAFQTEHAYTTPMGDRDWDGFGWAAPDLEPYASLEEIIRGARLMGVPSHLLPFRDDESNYYCFDTAQGRDRQEYPVVFWDHDQGGVLDVTHLKWDSFCDWLTSGLKAALGKNA